jgi:hypothetical protein
MEKKSSGCASFLKATFVIFGILTILALLGIGGGWYYWSTHKQQLMDSAKALQKEAQEAGKNTDEQGCVELSVERLKKDSGITGSVSSGLFLQFCLQSAKPTSDFCDGVPPETEFIDSARWRLAKCQGRSLDTNACQNLMGQIQRYCASDQRKTKQPAQ